MRKLILAAGVAALAITAPASAKPEKGGGQGGHAQAQRGGGGGGGQKAERRGGGGGQAQRVERRGGGGGDRQMQRAQRGGGGERQAQRMERRDGERQAQRTERRGGNERRFANFQQNERQAQRAERRGNDRKMQRVERRGNERQAQRIERRNDERRFANAQRDRNEQRAQRIENRGNRDFARIEQRGGDRRVGFVNDGDSRIYEARRVNAAQRDYWRNRSEGPRISWRERDDDFRRVERWNDWNDGDWDRVYGYRGIPAAYVGCPPGLAKKSWSCVPPGLARNMFIGTALPTYYSSNSFPVGLRDIYYDTDDYYYRWGDGYAYRVDRGDNLISALLPLVGAGLGVGMPFPYQGANYYVPSYYQSFYPDYGYDDDYYRYANGYVYEIDGNSGYIEDVIPLLDRGYGVGQMLPAGYSYYNVPYQYRDAYYDTDDYYYRYAPGAIYQVDRDSQLITSIASLLTGGLSVGQPLPPAYGVYNVPMGYRDTYYDTPDHWYRYSDGYIYQVDPTTQLITAIVRSIV